MKKIIVFLLIIIPNLGYCQTNTLSNKNYELVELFDKPSECRVIYKNDSILKLAAKHDAELSFNSPIKKYYRIGHAGGVRIEETQHLAIEQHKIWIEYTHCQPCKYQVEYNKVFERLYENEFKINLHLLIRNIENEAWEQDNKKRKKKE